MGEGVFFFSNGPHSIHKQSTRPHMQNAERNAGMEERGRGSSPGAGWGHRPPNPAAQGPSWTTRTTPSPSQLLTGPRGRTVANIIASGPSDRAAGCLASWWSGGLVVAGGAVLLWLVARSMALAHAAPCSLFLGVCAPSGCSTAAPASGCPASGGLRLVALAAVWVWAASLSLALGSWPRAAARGSTPCWVLSRVCCSGCYMLHAG
jgi:hypothetical protein